MPGRSCWIASIFPWRSSYRRSLATGVVGCGCCDASGDARRQVRTPTPARTLVAGRMGCLLPTSNRTGYTSTRLRASSVLKMRRMGAGRARLRLVTEPLQPALDVVLALGLLVLDSCSAARRGGVPLVHAHHAGAERLHVRVQRLVRGDDDQLVRPRRALDQLADHAVGVLAFGRHAQADGAELLRGHVRAQRMAVEDDRRADALGAAELADARHHFAAPIVHAPGPAPGAEQVVTVDQVGHARRRSQLEHAPQEALAVGIALQEHFAELARVEVDPLAEAAHVDGDAVHVLLRHVVTALRALHVVQLLQPASLFRLLERRPLLLALLAGHAGHLDQLLLVLPEPVVLARLLLLDQSGLRDFEEV